MLHWFKVEKWKHLKAISCTLARICLYCTSALAAAMERGRMLRYVCQRQSPGKREARYSVPWMLVVWYNLPVLMWPNITLVLLNDVLIRFSYNQGSEVRLTMTNDNHFQSYSKCNTLTMAVLWSFLLSNKGFECFVLYELWHQDKIATPHTDLNQKNGVVFWGAIIKWGRRQKWITELVTKELLIINWFCYHACFSRFGAEIKFSTEVTRKELKSELPVLLPVSRSRTWAHRKCR